MSTDRTVMCLVSLSPYNSAMPRITCNKGAIKRMNIGWRKDDAYLQFPVHVCREFGAFIDPQVDTELVINAATQLVLLHVDVQAIGDVHALAIGSDQLVSPGGDVVLQWPAK